MFKVLQPEEYDLCPFDYRTFAVSEKVGIP